MRQKVLEGASAGYDRLDEEAQHCKHSQATILDLLRLQLLQRGLVFAEVEHVEERATGVCRVAGAVAQEPKHRFIVFYHLCEDSSHSYEWSLTKT
jgi:hypothetical protein